MVIPIVGTSINPFLGSATASAPSSNPHVRKVHCGSVGVVFLYLPPKNEFLEVPVKRALEIEIPPVAN